MSATLVRPYSVLISAGETSGDRYGAELVLRMRELLGERISFLGVGGARMAAAGVDLVADFTAHSVVASVGFVPHLASIYAAYRRLLTRIEEQRPDLAILIDTPTFNLSFAAKLKRLRIPVVYFVSPQIWAWGWGRIKRIRRCVRKMIVIFPFEEELYRQQGVDVAYFGHPLVPEVKATLSRAEFCHKHALDPSAPVVSLLPGSRVEEVENVLPTLVGAARRLGAETQYVVSAASNIGTDRIRALVESSLTKESQRLKIAILREDLYDALKHSAAAAVCSGTATLETALIGTPFVMVYRIAPWRWALRGFFIRVPYYCIVNLIAGRQVVTELMQNEFTPQRTAEEIRQLLVDGAGRAEMAREFAGLRDLLDRGDALGSAAHSIVDLLSSMRIT